MAEVSQDADYFAYWNLSDIYDQCGYGAETFHGNYGMLNLQGFKKPSYHAHELLCCLGTESVPSVIEGSDMTGAIITEDERGINILVYNYIHEDQPDRGPVNLRVRLPENGHQLYDVDSIKLIRLNRHENNIVNRWEEMGSPGYLKQEHRDYLRNENTIRASADKPVFVKEENQLSFSMATPAAVFIEIPRR